jgi:hypothetical protein
MLAGLLKKLSPGQAIASMGYPDIALKPEQLQSLLGDKFSSLKYREDSAAIAKRHGMKADTLCPDAEHLFELCGVSLDVYDVIQERGCEIVCDLNYPLPERVCGQYDYVLDVGTAEHCFNVAQALVNMACLVNVGGTVFHENPFNWGNHGFYGLNPTLYHDFYTDNGFEVEIRLVTRDGRTCEAPPTKRFVMVGEEVNCFAIAKRLELRDIVFPTQTKYRKSLEVSCTPTPCIEKA